MASDQEFHGQINPATLSTYFSILLPVGLVFHTECSTQTQKAWKNHLDSGPKEMIRKIMGMKFESTASNE
jgi:hypothetical protein